MRGEHAISGFRNKDIRTRLMPAPINRLVARRQAGRIGRLLKRLHVRKLLAKVPHTRRWRVTRAGQQFLSIALLSYRRLYPHAVNALAA
jgi:hypothetical protein